MNPRIEILLEKKLIGKKERMSLVNNKTMELWQSFMLRRHEIENIVGNELYSIQEYDQMYFKDFNPQATFEKWAAIEVVDFDSIPDGMHPFILAGGMYAVFNYKGLSSDNSIFQYIYSTWIPNSEYELDNRPHFEILGEKYKNNDPNSEEEIWIPIQSK